MHNIRNPLCNNKMFLEESVTIDENVTETDLNQISVRLKYLKSATKTTLVPNLKFVYPPSSQKVRSS